MAEQRKITDTQIADLERKIADASARSGLIELENANLRTEISELRREIMVVDHSLSFDRARRAERGHKPPAKSAAAKSKPNGAKPSDGQQLPGFVTK
jgi:hypothetical protein